MPTAPGATGPRFENIYALDTSGTCKRHKHLFSHVSFQQTHTFWGYANRLAGREGVSKDYDDDGGKQRSRSEGGSDAAAGRNSKVIEDKCGWVSAWGALRRKALLEICLEEKYTSVMWGGKIMDEFKFLFKFYVWRDKQFEIFRVFWWNYFEKFKFRFLMILNLLNDFQDIFGEKSSQVCMSSVQVNIN